MQIDFHHAAIYVLSRLAGMKSKYAQKVAYSSQFVDDAVHAHALKFENGGAFHQTRTAHEIINVISSANVNDAFNVWLPFHFLPSGDGKDNLEKFITLPESTTINLLKKELMEAGDKEYGLYWLGIFLHLYADSYSHQGFIGFYDQHNYTELIRGVEKLGVKERSFKLLTKYIPFIFPVGHALVIKNPDIPYANWQYRQNGREFSINNLKHRFIPASKNIFKYIRDFLGKNKQYGSPVNEATLAFKIDKIIELLKYRGFLAQRYNNWLNHIHNNYFNFTDFDEIDENINYDDRAWFKEVVKAKKVDKISFQMLKYETYNYHKFTKKPDFLESDWTLFMRAAAIHKYRVLHKVLPDAGLEVG